eukprot:4767-Rhodomonas_salina.1
MAAATVPESERGGVQRATGRPSRLAPGLSHVAGAWRPLTRHVGAAGSEGGRPRRLAPRAGGQEGL